MPSTDSVTAARRSIQPFAAAASIIAYSPDTWYAATGTAEISATAASTSRYDPAGFTMTMSAPSARSRSASRRPSRALPASIW